MKAIHSLRNDTDSNEGRSVRSSVMAAAVQLFAEYGYHAASMRDIARMAGIQAASIYYHYASKQAILIEIMETYMTQLNVSLEHLLREESDSRRQLSTAIANHIRLHTTHKYEFFIIDTEIRSLEGEKRDAILSLRDHYEDLVQGILREGMEQGIFRPADVKITSYAIIAMCTEVANWFRPDGRLTVQQVIEMYGEMISRGVLA